MLPSSAHTSLLQPSSAALIYFDRSGRTDGASARNLFVERFTVNTNLATSGPCNGNCLANSGGSFLIAIFAAQPIDSSNGFTPFDDSTRPLPYASFDPLGAGVPYAWNHKSYITASLSLRPEKARRPHP